MRRVLVSLGSNLGDKLSYLSFVLKSVQELSDFELGKVSFVYESAFVENGTLMLERNTCYNLVFSMQTTLSPYETLTALLAIESEKRDRTLAPPPSGKYADRTIDVDLIDYEGVALCDSRLTLPHPIFRERAFVLRPLMDIVPGFICPVTDLSVEELWNRLPSIERENLTKVENEALV